MRFLLLVSLLLGALLSPLVAANQTTDYFIPSYGNSATNHSIVENKNLLSDQGITHWHK